MNDDVQLTGLIVPAAKTVDGVSTVADGTMALCSNHSHRVSRPVTIVREDRKPNKHLASHSVLLYSAGT